MRHLTWTFILLTGLTGCGRSSPEPAKPAPNGQVRRFIGDHAVAILSDPQKVEVYRVRDSGGLVVTSTTAGATAPATAPAGSRVAGYEIIAQAPDQDAGFGRELGAIFFSPDAYMFNAAKACIFQADTLLRVHGDGGRVDLTLCFHCDEFRLDAYDRQGKRVHAAAEDFDGARTRLASLVERATGVKPHQR